ncbi:TetR/AcrR family transcriptional regulator [Micromonospora inaquosa]|uniref:TetR/AcrR family transcriptional regulator n=1 Tax=Micromonospora inaquosa TaxID=2203716 RepID=UPI0033C8AFBD
MSGDQRSQLPGRPARTREPQVVLSDSEILQRGLDAFAEMGYRGASVRELAKRLGVSHNFINDRFGSKENFWRVVIDFAMEGMAREINVVFEADLDDGEVFRRAVVKFYSFAAKSPQANRIMSEESAADSGRLDYIFSNYTSQFLARLWPVAERLMDAGRVPRIPLAVLFTAVSGPALALTHSPMTQRLGGPANPTAEEVECWARSLAEVVLQGLLPAGPHRAPHAAE